MTTIRQIQANRLNAQHSTGPRSVEGKAVVSMNALQSGLDAKSVLIRGENPAELEALTTTYYNRWSPATPEQCALIDILIASEWLNRRYLRLEAQLWEDCMPDESTFKPKTFLARALGTGGALFDRVTRHQNAVARTYHTALRDLERLKKDELTAPTPDPDPLNSTPIDTHPPQLIHLESTSAPIGFVPTNAAREARNHPPAPAPTPTSAPRRQIGFVLSNAAPHPGGPASD
jgi:hypothetical protein